MRATGTEIRASSEESQLLLQAAACGDIDALKAADIEQILRARCNSGCTCLHWAAGSNQVNTLDYLVQERHIYVDIAATKKSRGRTPLHYACRNGHLQCAQRLVELGADIDARAKHSISPFQLAVWQCHLNIAQWLVHEGVDPAQTNEFDCGAVHWVGLCPYSTPGGNVIAFAEWLAQQSGVDFLLKQRQGHSPLHKSAWGGHLNLIQYLNVHHGMMDDTPDNAGNYAADLADMANTHRHREIAKYLRRHCSVDRARSCAILGVDYTTASPLDIRKAFLQKAKVLHPDRTTGKEVDVTFSAIQEAYDHLIKEDGIGKQMNPSHSLRRMLDATATKGEENAQDDDCFKARLIAVLLEYGDKGLDVGNIKKKWKQVWPDAPFPDEHANTLGSQQKRKGALLDYIKRNAGDSVVIIISNGVTRLIPSKFHQLSSIHQTRSDEKTLC